MLMVSFTCLSHSNVRIFNHRNNSIFTFLLVKEITESNRFLLHIIYHIFMFSHHFIMFILRTVVIFFLLNTMSFFIKFIKKTILIV